MSTTNKTVLGIVIAAVIILLAVFALRTPTASQETGASGVADTAALPTAATDTSDTAIQQDTAAIDAQLSGLDSDTATVDEGLSESQQ